MTTALLTFLHWINTNTHTYVRGSRGAYRHYDCLYDICRRIQAGQITLSASCIFLRHLSLDSHDTENYNVMNCPSLCFRSPSRTIDITETDRSSHGNGERYPWRPDLSWPGNADAATVRWEPRRNQDRCCLLNSSEISTRPGSDLQGLSIFFLSFSIPLPNRVAVFDLNLGTAIVSITCFLLALVSFLSRVWFVSLNLSSI